MFTTGESQMYPQFSAWSSNHMTLQHEQNCSLSHLNPSAFTASLAFLGHPSAVSGLFQVEHPGQNISYPSDNPCLKNFTQQGVGVLDKPIYASCDPQKRLLIFDRSGNRTRLFVSPSLSCQNNIIASEVPATVRFSSEKVVSGVDQQLLVKAVVEEKWDENNVNDGGEMLEDAEEINALLYSDSDDEYDDYDDDDDDTDDGTDIENDEVSSMRHTLYSIEDCVNKGKSLEEEVASSDGSPKRQKLLDGSCKKSSLVSVERPVSSCNHKDGVESHHGGARTSYPSKKVKIHEALKILGSIIPGLSSKDPLSIIEKAIVYLETMKIEAKALGVS